MKSRLCIAAVVSIMTITSVGYTARAKEMTVKDASPCADVPHSDHPKEMLSNGKLDVLVFLPDKTTATIVPHGLTGRARSPVCR